MESLIGLIPLFIVSFESAFQNFPFDRLPMFTMVDEKNRIGNVNKTVMTAKDERFLRNCYSYLFPNIRRIRTQWNIPLDTAMPGCKDFRTMNGFRNLITCESAFGAITRVYRKQGKDSQLSE